MRTTSSASMRSVGAVCVAMVVSVLLLSMQVEAAVVEYDWTVDYLSSAPDCVTKLVFGINGQYPSPTINVTEGDTVVVKLTNAIPSEGVVIHWHGIYQVSYHLIDRSRVPPEPESSN